MRLALAVVVLLSAIAAPRGAGSKNLVENGGFEAGKAGWEGGAIDRRNPHAGRNCLRVDDDDPAGDVAAGTAGLIPVAQEKTYLLRVWVRGDADRRQAMVSLNQYDQGRNWISGNNQDFPVSLSKDWTKFDLPVHAFHPEAASVRVSLRPVLWTESGNLTGRAWFDDVSLEERTLVRTVHGRWLRRGGPVRVWLAPVEEKVRREALLSNAATGVSAIHLTAAGGETEPFQVVLLPVADGALTGAAVSDLRGPDGALLPGSLFTVREVAYVNVTRPTDVPYFRGEVPDPLPRLEPPLALAAGRQQPLWLDIRVPKAAKAGEYRGALRLRFAAAQPLDLPLRLRVWDFALPAERHFRTAYGLDLDAIDRYHRLGGRRDDRRRALKLYLRDFAAHRVSVYDPFGDDRFDVSFPDWNWMDGDIRTDPADPASENRVLEVDDDRRGEAVSVRAEWSIRVRPGAGYTISWRARTDGRHDYLVAVNQYDRDDEWIPYWNLDFPRRGTGAWLSGSASFPASSISPRAVALRVHLYARRWTDSGELVGRTWFDDVAVRDGGAGPNLVVNGDFEMTPDKAAIELDVSRFDPAARFALDDLNADSFLLPLPYFAWGALGEHGSERFLGLAWGTPEYEKAYGRMLRLISDHLAAKGWLERAYAYWYDEPEPATYPFVVRGMDMLKRMEPRLKRLLTEQFEPALAGRVDIWTPVIDLFRPDWAAERRARGEEVWWYVCTWPPAPYPNNFIDHPGIEHRVRFWMAWRYALQGDLYWSTNWWTEDNVFPPPDYQDPWQDPMSYNFHRGVAGTWGNGDGRLVYPPRGWKDGRTRLEGPTPSLRWELIREGIEDFEYLWMLRKAADDLAARGLAPDLVRRARGLLVVPASLVRSTTSFTDDPYRLSSRRAQVAACLEDSLRTLSARR
ncbi:MAG: DUF4091 domain-containing protein, partial [Candidatus Aminicenantes bacterium]|nr:DUF4091 domain-containing protein [Candidatus Aminicenantes bacterium]